MFLKTNITYAILLASLARSPALAAADQLSKPEVQATIKEQKYCLGPIQTMPQKLSMPAGTIRTLLRVRLSYRNNAPQPLILPTLYHVSRLLVSRSIEDSAKGRLLFVAPHYLGASDKIIPKRTWAPTREFEVVPEGHTANYFDQHDIPILLDVHNPLSPGDKTELLGRRVYLQLELNHLRFSKEVARDLTQRWKAYGHLWTGKLRSSAMEINVPHAPKISNCDGEFGGID